LVPDQVLAHSEVHDQIGESLQVVNWGTREVWQSYTGAGFYVYDWDSRQQSYVRMAKPTASIAPELAESLGSDEGIPRLSFDFDHDEVIQIR